jgi:hypothetical protein
LAYIECAESERDTLFGVLARWWPEYDSMRKDARFSAAVD